MKPWHLPAFLLALLVAAIAGWIFDREGQQEVEAELEIPDNIDYYLVEARWRSFDPDGALNFELNTPHLEHFVKDDTSIVLEPEIRYIAGATSWNMRAQRGKMLHQQDAIELTNSVRIQRETADDPMQLSSEHLRLESLNEVVFFDHPLTLQSPRLRLNAQSAVLRIERGLHEFRGVRVIYHDQGA
jgi:LPS export ABC transporter protein LptC